MLATAPGFIYIVGSKKYHWFKVGVTTDFPKRLRALQTGCPFRLEVFFLGPREHGLNAEQNLHRRFRPKQLRPSCEWYDLSEADIRAIATDADVVRW